MIYSLLPLALMIACVVHAVRTNRVFPWIWVIVLLPGIGSLIYVAMAILPEVFGGHTARKVRTVATRAIDPHKEFRQAVRDVEMVGSVDARRALAEQLMQRGQFAAAIAHYQSALQGHFQNDPVLWLGLARAQFLNGDWAGAQASLDELQRVDPKFQSEEAHMIYARALEMQGKDSEALGEYAKLARYFAGEEARYRYAALLCKTGAVDEARAVYTQIVKSLDGAPSRYRKAQKEWGDAAKQALAG
ncbi:MAG: tetratricopeptide repeat protein [Proteobacteria bacterium]|nr:tetratricopeptide repeat protein [Pseudomonadota bacterium]